MNKKKKVIITIVAIILVLTIMGGLIWWIGTNKKEKKNSPIGNDSKINQLYIELTEKHTYSFTMTLDEQNTSFYAKKDNMAYVDTIYQGKQSKILIKDGNTYLLVEDQKNYYTYQNNEVDLNKIELQLEIIKDAEYTEGKEKIQGKEYYYEEYEGMSEFLIGNIENEEEQPTKTRFYFNGDKLEYIKTIVGEKQEMLKVDISYQVDNTLFEIPSNYRQA